MDRKVVIIPTYNEKENIEAILRKVFSLAGGFHVLVIDDGSPDGTAGIVKGLQEEFPERLHLLERSGKLGLGTAYLAGFSTQAEHAGPLRQAMLFAARQWMPLLLAAALLLIVVLLWALWRS